MTGAEIPLILTVLEIVQRVPAAAQAIAAWFRVNPNPTNEQILDMLAEWDGVRASSQAEVDEFNRLVEESD